MGLFNFFKKKKDDAPVAQAPDASAAPAPTADNSAPAPAPAAPTPPADNSTPPSTPTPPVV